MDAAEGSRRTAQFSTAWAGLLVFGLYLTCHGYHSRDNDQAYRLPLLLHQQSPAHFADDPFVRAFDAFNPHRGYLYLLDVTSRLLGLSATLALLYGLTFALTFSGIARLARVVWPGRGEGVGLIAAGLLFLTKAGNIGTNHLFEPILLDRLLAFALGWWAMGFLVRSPDRGGWAAAACLGLAGIIHPSLGLQLTALVGGSWFVWMVGTGRRPGEWRMAAATLSALGLATLPGLLFAASQGGRLTDGLPAEEMRLLGAYVQSPQHMIPHLWRLPQWLAWGCFPLLAGLAWSDRVDPADPARVRLAWMVGVNLAGLAVACWLVEVVGDLRITLFQPFRLATVARGLCLVLLAGRVERLWAEGWLGRTRALLLALGLVGDWTLVVVTVAEVAFQLAGRFGFGVLALGLVFLARHDTESGHWRLLLGLAAIGSMALVGRRLGRWEWTPRRRRLALAAAWAVPVLSLAAGLAYQGDGGRLDRIAEALAKRCRFAEIPTDDVERLAVWCRTHTPATARFVGPPQPKTFRLWSRRSLSFNRASSPYHAEGLADWAARFRDHVGFVGPTAEFARAYIDDRQQLERGFQALSLDELADLARRQGATHVLAARPTGTIPAAGPLELLRVDGRYAVYRVRPGGLVADGR